MQRTDKPEPAPLPFYPVPVRTVYHSGEYWRVHPNGCIERPGLVPPSPAWRMCGAVTLNNFGRTVRVYSLADVLTNPRGVPWTHGNGKARTHVLDFDHGTRRTWGGVAIVS